MATTNDELGTRNEQRATSNEDRGGEGDNENRDLSVLVSGTHGSTDTHSERANDLEANKPPIR